MAFSTAVVVEVLSIYMVKSMGDVVEVVQNFIAFEVIL